MSTLINDPEVLAFIEKTESFYPPEAISLTIEQQRAHYNRLCEAFARPRPVGIAVEDRALDGPGGMLPVRRYWPRNPGPTRIIYFHGGGFVVGGLKSHDDICAEIALRCASELFAIDYRLCPEHPHPAAFDDAMAAVMRLADRPLVLVGDSAGANLAAAVSLHAKADIRGQVLIYPGLGGEGAGLASYTERAEAPLLSTHDVQTYRQIRAGGLADPKDPTFSPIEAQSLRGAPPCFISAAEHDPLRDDGPAYVLKLSDDGVAAECVVEPDLPHGHLRARHMSTRAAEAFDRICDAISRFTAAS